MSQKKLVSLLPVILIGFAAFAQDARLPVHVSPREAYVFLDGKAIRDGSTVLKTTAGEHTIAVYNYGYEGEERKVNVAPGKNEAQAFTLKKAGADVSSPYGYIQIEGPGRAAVMLNGDAPEFLVGHVDEFNNHIIWKQQLIVPVGTHQLLVTRKGQTLYSGPIEVGRGQRVIVNIKKQTTRVQSVDNGVGLTRPRFKTGVASAAITVAPVTGSFAATPAQINCNQNSQLAYTSTETLHRSIRDDTEVKKLPDPDGQIAISPRKTTTYTYEASGPGGIVKQDATISVNPVIQSSLEASPGQVQYLKIGDKVLSQGSADLKWKVDNADKISIDPVGEVSASVPGTSTGERKITPDPKPVTGTVDETKTYTLTATNVCGGSDTKTAQVQVKGMMQPYILSVFFPTNEPTKQHPDQGLVASQQQTLTDLAKAFAIYSQQTPDAKLVVRGHADPRGGGPYNLKLSERRVAAVKAFLVAQGVPEDKISSVALGETNGLDAAAVQKLEAENPFKAGADEQDERATQLAYNRRIDVELQPANIETAQFFPHEVTDAKLLMSPTTSTEGTVVASRSGSRGRNPGSTVAEAKPAERSVGTMALPQSGSLLPLTAVIGLSLLSAGLIVRKFAH